ncbi:uncharacterized protein ARMOST_19020 [Armillaria ostoyae]|uniref:Uncharacterized protein n=1 Tax=Armillaria ostoyae TaxID=47428 RepID=A0A284S3C8_ARMOS|nr:uncharacterized protein ARMOST_19020 [Armillaria ostoyae]
MMSSSSELDAGMCRSSKVASSRLPPLVGWYSRIFSSTPPRSEIQPLTSRKRLRLLATDCRLSLIGRHSFGPREYHKSPNPTNTLARRIRPRIWVACALSDVPGNDKATAGIASLFLSHFSNIQAGAEDTPVHLEEIYTRAWDTGFTIKIVFSPLRYLGEEHLLDSLYIAAASVRWELFGVALDARLPSEGPE